MKAHIKIMAALALSLSTQAVAQSGTAEYDYSAYAAKIYRGKKAKINFAGNAAARSYRTVITEAYNNSKVDFGGQYIVATWGCGMDCVAGAIVDAQTGKVYDLPWDAAVDESEELYFNGGFSYHADSRLLIGTIDQDGKRTSYYFVWDEPGKRFKRLNGN